MPFINLDQPRVVLQSTVRFDSFSLDMLSDQLKYWAEIDGDQQLVRIYTYV